MSEIPPPNVPPGSYTPPPPPPPGGGYGAPAGSGDRTIWIILSYLGLLALIPYFAKKDDPDQELRWHAKNGLGLCLAEVAICIVLFVLSFALSRIPGASCLTWAIQCVLPIGFLVISIICIIKGVNGQRYRIPVITDFAEKSL